MQATPIINTDDLSIKNGIVWNCISDRRGEKRERSRSRDLFWLRENIFHVGNRRAHGSPLYFNSNRHAESSNGSACLLNWHW
jgi:hypothetical protein